METHPRSTRASFVTALSLLLLAPSGAHAAQGLNLAWNHCLGSGLGVQNAVFACDTNSGSHAIIGSYVLANDFPQVIGNEIVLQLASASPALPPWWEFRNPGTCRPTSLSAPLTADPNEAACVDWSQGQQAGGLASYCTAAGECVDHPTDLNVARVKVIGAVAPQAAQDLVAGVEYFVFNLVIDHARTVGSGSCAGCSVPVCIVLNSINVVDQANHMRFLTAPSGPGSNYIAWQGGGVPVVGGISGCPAATATRKSAWGTLKALYR
jgi:hypothetical protein